jgi:cytochrome c-type biogenesis protein CcmH/NrfF
MGMALAQTASQIESDEVKRVGAHINCQCGSCTENVNCNMSSGQCHFCKPTRTKIWELQKAGMDDNGIIEYLKKQYGEAVFRADPNSYFWMIPYRKMRGSAVHRPAVAGGAPQHDNIPDRYRAAAEKESENIE